MEIQSTRAIKPEKPREKLTAAQWKGGIAAWLGWMFDGLDMHLYTLVAAPFVARLIHESDLSSFAVKKYSAWIQAAFLLGWALGGGVFGRIGDRLGRSRTLSLTVLAYAMFTGLSFFVQTWWQLLICRFLAALGIGGEWAVGASLLAETWPKKWRPWIAAVLQTGVNVGVLFACLTGYGMAAWPERYVFLVGVVPAFLVFYIRRNVPETEVWKEARAKGEEPSIAELFRGGIRRTTYMTIALCALTLSGWWAFMFWQAQYLQALPELSSWPASERRQFVSMVFSLIIGISCLGNFFAGWLAIRWGYRRTMAFMFVCFFVAIYGAFCRTWSHRELTFWLPTVGFFSGVFGLFTMYLPPLFPTLLRTTGAGFCYNIGRIAAAAGTVVFGLAFSVGDIRQALFYDAFLFLPAAVLSWFMPELSAEEGGLSTGSNVRPDVARNC
jgi:MFS family permease